MSKILVCMEGCPKSKEHPLFMALITIRADKNANFVQGELILELASERFKCAYCGSNVRREYVAPAGTPSHKCRMPGCRTNNQKVNANYCRACAKKIKERERELAMVPKEKAAKPRKKAVKKKRGKK